jgi:hypothetical protein
MDPAGSWIGIASKAVAPLVIRLFRQPGPGAGLITDGPVRVASLVSFRGERRTLGDAELRTLADELVRRAATAVGPHDAVPDAELPAVADAVCRTLTGLGELTVEDAYAVQLGYREFARRLRRQSPAAVRELTADATVFHDRLIETAALHILHFFTQRSTFIARTLVEQIRLLEQNTRLLERLADRSREDAEFEADYATSLARQFSDVTIVGLDLPNSPNDSWPLDAIYLSLDVTSTELQQEEETGQRQLPVDQALGDEERVLLRGLAGAGKTTLVHWLAVSTASGRLPADLQSLRGRIPFVLPVRRFADREVPNPAEFLSATRHPLAGSEPHGWAVRVLKAGRGLLLIDGVDEAPAERRAEIRRGIAELLRAWPGNLCLVTSRPSAVQENWLAAQGFVELTLTEMNRDQITSFVQRWHQAAAEQSKRSIKDPEDRRRYVERLETFEQRLQHAVRLIGELRMLATNPLMCGLICALNRDRNGSLPTGRKELYRAALAMLLQRRDDERDVAADGIVLERDAKERLLQKLAHWMLLNGRTEMSAEQAVAELGLFLPAIPSAARQGSSAELFDHLLQRSGLLKLQSGSPAGSAVAVGAADAQVEFIHRTFQDYLAAKECVDRRHIGYILRHAHEEDWGEVVRMAVLVARPDECAQILDHLVSARPNAAEGRHCKLLAAASVHHATEMDPEVREKVRQATKSLVMPFSLDGARKLGWLGGFVLELLPDPEDLPDRQALLRAATAANVADEAAIDYLIRLRTRRSLAIRAELAGAWHRFDTDYYAEQIIAHLHPEELYFSVTGPQELAVLRQLGGRARIRATERLGPGELIDQLDPEQLTHLWLPYYDVRRSLEWLTAFPRLRVLRLDRTVGAVQGIPPGIRLERHR